MMVGANYGGAVSLRIDGFLFVKNVIYAIIKIRKIGNLEAKIQRMGQNMRDKILPRLPSAIELAAFSFIKTKKPPEGGSFSLHRTGQSSQVRMVLSATHELDQQPIDKVCSDACCDGE